MIRLLLLALSCLAALFPRAAHAGKIQCPEMGVVLYGIAPTIAGGTYEERVMMHKVGGGSGVNGRWRIDEFRQTNTYPWPIDIPVHTDEKVDFTFGMWMRCVGDVVGNQIVSVCRDGNLSLDVVNRRIGYLKTNIWIGTIAGNEVELKFDRGNPVEPVLHGTIQKIAGGSLDVRIVEPTSGQVAFDEAKPGKLTVKFRATATPPEKAESVQWTLPTIEGSAVTTTPSPAVGSEVEMTFTGLPAKNAAFGKKVVRAEIDAGFCKATDEKNIAVFFPRDAKNNPDGTVPNWFYYWSQTPARKGPAQYGGTSGQCSRDSGNGREGILGYYRNTILDDKYFICDLARLPGDMDFTAVKIASRQPLAIDSVKTFGIDTFAVASTHENEHFTHFKDWWFRFKPNNPIRPSGGHMKPEYDADGDFIPNDVEPGLRLDPNDKYTLRQLDASIDVDDEEWLAWLAEATWSLGGADSEDWARPGRQWK